MGLLANGTQQQQDRTSKRDSSMDSSTDKQAIIGR